MKNKISFEEKRNIILYLFEREVRGDVVEQLIWFLEAEWDSNQWYIYQKSYIIWLDGVWKTGQWEGGEWHNGIWKDGIWDGGHWYNGVWEDGEFRYGKWHDGIWKDGYWQGGEIYNPKTKEYEESEVPPNECKWSLSYKK